MSSLDVLCTFYIFFGTNLLIQCQVRVPVFSVFLALFISDFGTESKRNKIPEMIFSRRKKIRGLQGQARRATGGPQAWVARPTPLVVGWGLVGPLGLPCLGSQAPQSSSVPKKICSGILFRLDFVSKSPLKGVKNMEKTGIGTWH